MRTATQNVLFLVVYSLILSLSSPQCLLYKGMQCLECQPGYEFVGEDCVLQLVKINERSTGKGQVPLPVLNRSDENVDLVESDQKQTVDNFTNTNIFEDHLVKIKKVQSSQSKSDFSQIPIVITSNESLIFVKIKQIPQVQVKSASKNTNESDSIQGVNKPQAPNSTILIDQILLCLVNKISLELFDFSRVSSLPDQLDPVTRQILRRVQTIYKGELAHSNYLVSFYRFLTFTKSYKIYYFTTSPGRIWIYQVGAIVDLFHMQIFISTFAVYSTVDINQQSLLEIKSKTKRN